MHKISQPRPRSSKSKRPERVLLLCYFDPSGISTVPENIGYLQSFSSLSIDVLNFHGQIAPFQLSSNFTLQEYDAVLFHNTITYNIDCIANIDARIKQKFEDYDGLKVLFKQDEHYRARRVAEFIERIKADLVFSCLPESEYLRVYPKKIARDIHFAHMLTGFVTPPMRQYPYSQKEKRQIDVGYRGSNQPIYFGRLAYEKRQIADDFLLAAAGSGLVLDISSDWAARLPGNKWIQFLTKCKATLGTESGASIFDLSGEVERAYQRITREIGEHPEDRKWCEKVLELLAEYEGRIEYNQISPRHFEAAATRTLQFLYDGEYSGVFHPYKHYIPVRKDLSNFEELKSVLSDERLRCEITERAFEEVILDHRNWIESFANSFDQQIIQSLAIKGTRTRQWLSAKPVKTNVLLICGHRPHLDPRIGWIAANAPEGVLLHVIGLHDDQGLVKEKISRTKSGGFEIEVYRKRCEAVWLTSLNPSADSLNPGAAAVSLLFHLLNTPKGIAMQFLGLKKGDSRYNAFMWYLSHFTDTVTALSFHGARLTNIDVVIATDLDTLAAGIILKEYFNSALFYDAHEYWPENDVSNAVWEKDYWRSFENFLLPSVDFATTVSPQLADHMSSVYGHPFVAIPNCEPLQSELKNIESLRLVSGPDQVAFLYQGNYGKGRGLELLIQEWPKTNTRAYLFLRGQHTSYQKALIMHAKSTGLLEQRIFFLDPVSEKELVSAARSADVGIIPYEPICINHKYCCPNKLSQYCQAGIPILANRTDFVAGVVTRHDLGLVVDFDNSAELVKAVNILTENPTKRAKAGQRAFEFAKREYHWGLAAQPLYEAIQRYPQNLAMQMEAQSQTMLIQARNPQIHVKYSIDWRLKSNFVELVSNPKIMGNNVYVFLRFFWRLIPMAWRLKLVALIMR